MGTSPFADRPHVRRSVGGASADPVSDLPRRLHLLGAGGAGLSGAARLLLARGHVLSGHDREVSPFTRVLEELGVELALSPSEDGRLPSDVEAVVRSAAVAADDPQLVEARERGLRILKYAELVGLLCPPGRTLAVAGTHGKTTTAWMLHHALAAIADSDISPDARVPMPGALVGGLHRVLNTNAVVPETGGWFSVEACEYDRSFLRIAPAGAVVTNVEADHLDYYGDYDELEAAFCRFVDGVHPDGLIVVGPDVPDRVTSAARCDVWRVGRELEIDLFAERRGRFGFRLRGPGWASTPAALAVPGSFNVQNAALALGLAVGLTARVARIDLNDASAVAASAMHHFPGVARRFEPWGVAGGVDVVHDYAHHPTEVAAVLEAARRALPGRALHVLFQPHQHSRTARFLGDFVEALRGADRVIVADVYGARMHIDTLGAGAEELVSRLRRAGVYAAQGGPPRRAATALAEGAVPGCAALVLGAGDIDGIRDDLFRELALRGDSPR